MNCTEDCTLTFGEKSNDEDVRHIKQFLIRMRNGLARTTTRAFKVEVVHYRFISKDGSIVIDKVKTVDVSCLFDLEGRDCSHSTLYTHHGLVATDLLLMLKEVHKWDGYRLEVAFHGYSLENEQQDVAMTA